MIALGDVPTLVTPRLSLRRPVLADAIGRLNPLPRDGTGLEVKRLLLDGDTAAAELASTCTGLDGGSYDNALCWVCRFDSAEPGATIVEVREYLDSAMITWLVERNEPTRPRAGQR